MIADGCVSRRGFLAIAAGFFQAAAQDAKYSSDVKVVNVLATVRNKKGQIVRNLTKDDFALTEEGRAQTVRYFSQQADLPLTLGLLVDTSRSQRGVLGKEKDATYTFIDRVMREAKDQAFLIQFAREAELLRDLTGSKKQLEDALKLVKGDDSSSARGQGRGRGGARGGTVLYDAVLLASDEIMKKQAGRKAIILLTDGVDSGSKVGIAEAISAAQRADTLVYSILFADKNVYNNQGPMGGPGGRGRRRGGGGYPPPGAGSNRPDGKKILQRISLETGGGFFEVSGKHPVEKIYDQIEEELRNQYSLGYTSNLTEGPGYRRIALTVNKKDMVVHTRQGYYAN